MITLGDIPQVKKYLSKKLPKNSFQRINAETGIIMNYDKVLELLDTLDNTTYSIRFTFDNSPEGEFFNLVVGKTATGEYSEPSVLGYLCDDTQVNTFVEKNYDMDYFIGTISLYNYHDFFTQGRVKGTVLYKK